MAGQSKAAFCVAQGPGLTVGNTALLRVIEDPSIAALGQESRPPRGAGPLASARAGLPNPGLESALEGPLASAPVQSSQALLPGRTLSHYPRAGTLAATPVWTPIYQHGSYCHSPLLMIASLHLGTS
ncbi:hypothetical protein GHT09_008994 [Marmota monax]|uniref:Uncharacterized protein n=1 Tax=Marmota monax TaxID=9995 RepID=A0A834QHY7_MARMO|nr:hypothetical protein GHT09_008994 [Marmota monax]